MLSAMNYYEKEENIDHSSISSSLRDPRCFSGVSHVYITYSFHSHGTNNSPHCSVQIFANFEDRKQIYCPGFVSFLVTTQNFLAPSGAQGVTHNEFLSLQPKIL